MSVVGILDIGVHSGQHCREPGTDSLAFMVESISGVCISFIHRAQDDVTVLEAYSLPAICL